MKISELGVKRPVTTLMVFLTVFILGVVSYTKLSVDMMPEIESPSISVFTTWDGASAEDVETKMGIGNGVENTAKNNCNKRKFEQHFSLKMLFHFIKNKIPFKIIIEK